MITNQIIQTSIDDIFHITKNEMAVFDVNGLTVASTLQDGAVEQALIFGFLHSPAESQIAGGFHWFKVMDDEELAYILVAKADGPDVYSVGKIEVAQLQNLIVAYKEKFDRNSFLQNLLLDNLLLVDIYSRARKLHINNDDLRAVFLVQTKQDKNTESMELMKSLFSTQSGDYITSVDANNIVLIKHLDRQMDVTELSDIAATIVDMMSTEAMMSVKVAFGTIVTELKSVSKSYKEAKMALDVGKIFYYEKNIIAYSKLGIGRLIYQLPQNLCKMFMEEIFGDDIPDEIDDEMLATVNKFFENNLNISETSRQLFLHRNTLVYRIEKLAKATGLDIRTFDDALTFKIALMVVNYMRYLEEEEN